MIHDEPPTESERLYGEFIAGLPAMLHAAGCTDSSALGAALDATVKRFGPLPGDSPNLMIRNALRLGLFPVRPGYEIPFKPIASPGEDVDDGQ